MKKMIKVLTICLMVIVYAQTVYAMDSEAIAQALNSTFNTEFTSKHIDSLSKKERANLENIAEQLYLVSPEREIDRQETLGIITGVADALTPTDPTATGLKTVLTGLAGKTGKVVKYGELTMAGGLAYGLYKILKEDFGLPHGIAYNATAEYIGLRNSGETHENAWSYIKKDNTIPEKPDFEKRVKTVFDASKIATEGSDKWNQVKNDVVLPLFESSKKTVEQKRTFMKTIKAKMKDIWEQVKDKLILIAKAEGQPFQPIAEPFVQVVKTPSDASKFSERIVGYVNKLDNVAPQLVGVSNTARSISFTFNEPMGSHFHTHTWGFGAGISCCTESWSSNRKTYTQTYSGNFYPSGSIVSYTINPDPNVPPGGKFSDLSGNAAPQKSGSFVIP